MEISKIGMVVVSYNPENSFNDKITQLSEFLDLVVVVDNNSTNKEILNDLTKENIIILHNDENYGLAKALNQGCDILVSNKCSHGLLLDQDSNIDDVSINYLFEKISTNSYGLVGPQIILRVGNNYIETNYLIKTKLFFKKVIANNDIEVLINITSGSVIDLKIWEEIGRFWEGLFIEGIDDEYCLRLNKFGFKVIIDPRAKLYQVYGEQKHIRKLGVNWYPTNHSPLRIEYLYRNKVIIMKKYFFDQKQYVIFQILSLFKRMITILVAEDQRILKIKKILGGISKGLKSEEGKIN